MRVTVTIPLDIDEDAWTATYGVEGAAAIRADVKDHATNLVRETYREFEVLL